MIRDLRVDNMKKMMMRGMSNMKKVNDKMMRIERIKKKMTMMMMKMVIG